MKLQLLLNFETDGDFHFNNPESMIDVKSSLYKGAKINYSWLRGDESISFALVCAGADLPCRLAARDLLQSLMANFRVGTHVHLIKDFYAFLMGPIENKVLFDRDQDIDYDDNITGNYEGTYLRLIIQRENDEPCQRTRIEIENEYKEVIKDSTIIGGGYANQERRNELLEEYRATLSEEAQLAIWLHEHLCHYNHTDACSWSYEIDGVHDNWNGYAHKEYLDMAQRMMNQCSDINTIKNIITAIK